MKKALMTNLYLAKYTGSELHTIEMAKLLCAKGYEVTIAVQLKAYPLMKIIESLNGKITVIECQKDKLEETEFDLIIVQHYSVFDYLCCKYAITCKNLIVSKLSVISDYELLPKCTKDADMILAVSEECAEDIVSQGVGREKIEVFKNSVDNSYFEKYKYKNKKNLTNGGKIAVISNHVSEEVAKLKEVMGEKYFVDYIGIEYTPKYVTVELLEKYDLIITIGRTVQQCFAIGVPVYVYDYFGGPGYICESNFEIAEKYNFSGRGFDKKSVEDLKKDIINNYSKNIQSVEWLNKIAREKYSYQNNFDKIYLKLSESNRVIECSDYELQEKKRVCAYSKCMLDNLIEKSIQSQLYIDRGNGFNENDSIRWDVMEKCEIVYETVIEERVQGIRFDPANCPGICQINSFKINEIEKETNKEIVGADYDPMLFIELSSEEKECDLLKIEMRYCIKRMNEGELIDYYKTQCKTMKDNVEMLNEKMIMNEEVIKNLKYEKIRIQNSSSWKLTKPLRKIGAIVKKQEGK